MGFSVFTCSSTATARLRMHEFNQVMRKQMRLPANDRDAEVEYLADVGKPDISDAVPERLSREHGMDFIILPP